MHNTNINHKKHLYGLNLRRSSSFLRVINLKMASVLSFVILALLFLAIIAPVHFKTELAEAAPGTPTASTLSFTGTNLVASATLTVNSPTGSFATSGENEKSSFSISTNNYTGYTLTLRSSGTNTSLSDGGSHIISTLPASTTQAVFSASDTTGQVLNNRWGYIPSYYNSVANTTTYYPAPTSVNTATLRATSSANSADGTSNADNYTIGLGFRADYNSPSGTYANDTFVLEYIANSIGYLITYDKNTNDTVTNMPYSSNNNQQAGDTSSTTITLSNLVPARTGYGFLGWCLGTVTTTNGVDTCSGTVFNPNGDGTNLSFGIDQTTTNTPTIYAMWDRIYTLTFLTANNANSIVFNGETFTNNQTKTFRASELTNPYHIYGNYATRYAFSSWTVTAGTLENSTYQNTAYTVTGDATITLTGQQVTTAIQNLPLASCSTTAMPVYDNRDDSVYWIQELPDGNCWMLDNLALDLTSSTIVNSLSITNTHLDATALGYFVNGGGTSSDRYPITAYGTFGSTASYSQPLTNVDSKNTTLRPSSATDYTDSIVGAYGKGQGKVGAYYNYCAASVGYYCFGDGSSAGTPSGDNDYDVCPAGWRMPTGGVSGEYNALYTNSAINSDATIYRNTLSTSLSGLFTNGHASNRGIGGLFWSSTKHNSNYSMYYTYVGSSYVNPTTNYYRSDGYSVRCILPYYTITFRTNNATGIVFNGVTYTDGQTIKIPKDEAAVNKYHIYGNYGTRYAFSSWSATAGTFENQNYQNTAFTVTGNTTITLNGQYVNTAMQNLSLSNCSTSAMPVYDTRDSSVYWVQKLADGNCWMLDNLALDLTSSTIVNALSTANTNLDSTSLTYFKNGGGIATDRYPITAYGTFGSPNSYSQPLTNVDSKNTTLRPSSAIDYTDSIVGAYGQGQNKIGAYYNYCAASMGYYCFGSGTSSGTVLGNDTTYDVCPAGWRMPFGGLSGEYNALYTNSAINSDVAIYRNTLSTPFSGMYNNGSASNSGSLGYFWSSTVYGNSSSFIYGTVVMPNNLAIATTSPRQLGMSVRCTLINSSQNITDLEYMQDFATLTNADKYSVLASMPFNQQFQLMDNRDNKTYYISKLADGNVWMTQNLDHNIVAQANYYTPANTDIPSAWTPNIATYATGTSTWIDSDFTPESYDPGNYCWDSIIDSYTAVACNQSGNHYHLGNYYNWTAAVATNDSSSFGISNDQSICPAGWRLPSTSGSRDYSNIGTILGLTSGASGNIQDSPAFFTYSGRWTGSYSGIGGEYIGAVGLYYTSDTPTTSGKAHALFFVSNGNLTYNTSGDRNIGFSVRCVAR